MKRISWDQYFSSMTEIVSKRSSCVSRQVGAVIVKDNVMLSTGYNGSPKGLPNCCDIGVCHRRELGYGSGEGLQHCRAAHAETNAIALAAKNGQCIDGATIYINTQPCGECTKLLVNAGIKEVVYTQDYPNSPSEQLLKDAGVLVRKLQTSSEEK